MKIVEPPAFELLFAAPFTIQPGGIRKMQVGDVGQEHGVFPRRIAHREEAIRVLVEGIGLHQGRRAAGVGAQVPEHGEEVGIRSEQARLLEGLVGQVVLAAEEAHLPQRQEEGRQAEAGVGLFEDHGLGLVQALLG